MTAVLARPGLALRPCADTERWDRTVAAHPDGTPCHVSAFLQAVGEVLGLRVELTELVVDDEPVGLVPLLIRARGPLLSVNHGVPVPYLSPLVPADLPLDAVAEAVHRYLRPRRVVHLGIWSVNPIAVPAGPGWTGLEGYDRAVIPVAGRTPDDLAAGFGSRLQRATKAGVTTGPATREEIAASFDDWANLPLARQGVPPRWPAGAHLALHDALAPSGLTVTIAARRDGELVALSSELIFGRRSIGWEIGISEAGRKTGASTMLSLDGLLRARERGAEEFDLLGAPTPGIADFKRSIGAELLPRGVAEWVSPTVPAVRRLAAATRLARRLAGGRR